MIASPFNLFDLIFHSNTRSQTSKEDPAGLQHSPHLSDHAMPVRFVSGKVQHRAADYHVKLSSSNGICSMAAARKLSSGRCGASCAASDRICAIASLD